MTARELKTLLENVPDEIDVVIVMHYSFKPLIEGIANGQTLGSVKAMVAAKWLLPHMEQWQTWHAYIQTIDVRIGPNRQTPELRLRNVTEPLCIVEDPAQEYRRLPLLRAPSPSGRPQLPAGNGTVKR